MPQKYCKGKCNEENALGKCPEKVPAESAWGKYLEKEPRKESAQEKSTLGKKGSGKCIEKKVSGEKSARGQKIMG